MRRPVAFKLVASALFVGGLACDGGATSDKPTHKRDAPDAAQRTADLPPVVPASSKVDALVATVRDGNDEAAAAALQELLPMRFDQPLPAALTGIVAARVAKGDVWAAGDIVYVGGVSAAAEALGSATDDAVVAAIAVPLGRAFQLVTPDESPPTSEEGARASAALAKHVSREGAAKDVLAALRSIGVQADPSAQLAVAGLLDDVGGRSGAAETLAAIGGGPNAVKLIPYLGDANEFVRTKIAVAIGCSGAEVVAPLRKQMAKGTPQAQRAAAVALGYAGPAAAVAVDDLIARLGHADLDAVDEAAEALARIGPAAAKAIPALKRVDAAARKAGQPRVSASIAVDVINERADAATDGCPGRDAK